MPLKMYGEVTWKLKMYIEDVERLNMNDQKQYFKLAHIGINAENEKEALIAANIFAHFFGFFIKEGKDSVFVGREIEIMKDCNTGKHGHIAFQVECIQSAIEKMEGCGGAFDRTRFKYDEKGNILAAYLEGEVLGFRIHLTSPAL